MPKKRKSSGPKYRKAGGKTVASAMRRRKRGTLKSRRSGKGGTVKSRKQAIAIGLAQARKKELRFLDRRPHKEERIIDLPRGDSFQSILMSSNPAVIVIGAAVAGLAAAWQLGHAGIAAHIIEAHDRSGRVLPHLDELVLGASAADQ